MVRVGSLGSIVARNNRRIAERHPLGANPIDLADVPWHESMVAAWPDIRAEWDAFVVADGRLPHIGAVLRESQGNDGPWRAGILTSGRRTTELARTSFPRTLVALRSIPGLRAALWSLFEPGTELPEHCGPNHGVLRYHLCVVSHGSTALEVAGRTTPYVEGAGLLFDDTAPHRAWNRGDRARVTLFCEVDRPLPLPDRLANRGTQQLMALDPRRRRAIATADEWHAALNPY